MADVPQDPVPDLSEALDWKPGARSMSGRAANSIVSETLHRLDRAFADYMGDPPVPSLLTYAKHASRTVGSQLARMEAAMRFLRYFDLNALVDLRRDLRDGPVMRAQTRAVLGQLARNPLRSYSTLTRLRHAILWGNLQAYGSLVPAFSCFLEAETQGRDGLEAMRDAGYGDAPLDPAGLVERAFGLYQASRRIGGLIGGQDDHIRLASTREHLAFHATLTLSLHEQMLFQSSECYDDPVVRRVVGRLTPTLTIEDPVDTMYLLPDGGNWADFTDRMGIEEDADGSIRLRDPAGEEHRYVVAAQGRLAGTIFDYLSSRFRDPEAAAGVAQPPLPLPAYDDGEGRAIARLRQSYRRLRGTYQPGVPGTQY